MHVLVVDLLAERQAFGGLGVKAMVAPFEPTRISLWAPHTTDHCDYGFGHRVGGPVEADAIIISGSKRNVSSWEGWMDEVAELIRTTTVPLYGICFGHQIIAASLGGRVERASHPSKFIGQVNWDDGRSTSSLFTHQDHVVDAGEMEIIATSEHCGIVACQHPTRAIRTVQFHPEASSDLITQALNLGEMTAEEHTAYVFESEVMSVKNALLL